MSSYLVLLVLAAAVAGLGWMIRQRSTHVLWRDPRYQAVLDTLEDGLLVYDRDGQLVYLNRAARTWFQRNGSRGLLDAQSLLEQISPRDEFLALFSQKGQASLQVGPLSIEAVSEFVDVNGNKHTTIRLHDVTAPKALTSEERRRSSALAVLKALNPATNTEKEIDRLLDHTLEKLQELAPSTSGAIRLWHPETQQLVVHTYIGSLAPVGTAPSSDEGLSQTIFHQREPLLVADTSGRSVTGLDAAIMSYVGVPLTTGTEPIGTLELFSDRPNTFSPETLNLLQIVANYLAIVSQNVRLSNEASVRAEELATMNTLSAAINASLNLDELLEIIIFSVNQAIECDRLAVFLMDNERGLLSLGKAHNLSQDFIRQHQNIRPQLGGKGQVILDRYPLIVGDSHQAETPPQIASLMAQEGIASFIDLPLRGREHVLGALTVYYNRPRTFDESELDLLRAIANQVTLALENARLYEQTDRALARRVDQLAAIEEIGRELTSTLDITRVFNLVLQRAMGSTGASAGFLALLDSTGERLELIVDRGYPKGSLEPYRLEGWPTSQGITGRVVHTGETALINKLQSDHEIAAFLPDTRAVLTVPIVKEAHTLGVVALESSRAKGFSPEDVRFTSQLAELAAIAIDNARLFQQVREARDNLQAILDSTHEGILVIDRGNRVVLANPMIEEISGLSAETLLGRPAEELINELGPPILTLLGYSDAETAEALDLLDVTSADVAKRTYEVPNAPARHIEQVALPVIDKDEAVVGRVIVLRDVTEEHRLAVMRQNMTDMIIHDLRSPLTAVIGGVQVASDLTAVSADPEAIQHALAMADQSCNRLMSLVDSLLDISRLEAGQMPLQRQPILLPKIAESVIQQMEPLAKKGSVTLELESASEIPPVDADLDLVNRVLVNLVDNALKHSPPKALVAIKVGLDPEYQEQTQEDSSDDQAHRLVRCTVLDQGPGIPVEFRKRVFERFAQLDDRRKGKGLGLAFCQLAIHAHGGRIWVEDNPTGKGSAFIFTLPVVPTLEFSPSALE